MHLLVAAHDLYPDSGSGGTGRYVYETARRLLDRGHRVSVVTRRRGDAPPRGTVDGIDVYRYDIDIAGERGDRVLRQLPGALRRVADAVTEANRRAPVDHVSFQGPVTSLFVDRCVDDSVPRSATFHSPWPTEYRIRAREESGVSNPRRELNARARAAVERYVLGQADHVVTLSDYMREQYRRVYDAPAQASVIPGGVDVERFEPAVDDRYDVEGDPALLTVRRLSPRMGHDLLIDAFARVADDHPGAHLHVAGDGPLRADLERRAADRGVADRTTFHGYVPDADLPGAYAAADLFVLPTTQLEGFGLATLEALAAGTPVVATPVGGTTEVLDGLDDAVPADPLASEATPPALADRLDSWLDLPDERLRAAGGASRTHACRNFTWESTVDSLERFYESRLRE
ncbi:glycosyltransferase family 4 protein [Halomicrococcus sp. NG-SE-24]|uniref:glycosyltransferase family 4 protein n=1 Tax=Halomicrococcus sp. NG-SE-24 TaxID=3436928 RepID=UPI003D991298